MTAASERLRAMHYGPQPLILPNVWDATSAKAFADAGFPALATSSSAIASTLGYRDGQTPAAEMLAAVARIARSVSVPVTADVEDGYGLPIAEFVARLAEAGAVGCNLEDSDRGSRMLAEPGQQAEYIAAVRAAAGQDLVINARVDVFVRTAPGEHGVFSAAALDDAVARSVSYLRAGADCVYPILAPAAMLPDLVARAGGPVNAMYRPGGPTLAELGAMRIARITFGGGLHTRASQAIGDMAADLAAESNATTADAD